MGLNKNELCRIEHNEFRMNHQKKPQSFETNFSFIIKFWLLKKKERQTDLHHFASKETNNCSF